MDALYHLGVLGAPSAETELALRTHVEQQLSPFKLRLGEEVSWECTPEPFQPSARRGSAAIFFAGPAALSNPIDELLAQGIPVIPVVASVASATQELPATLHPFNAVSLTVGWERLASSLLESAGILTRQRRAFISYRRDEAQTAALQVYDVLADRHYETFLDTRGVPPAAAFQTVLWHRLCDADVLIMLDTPTYFESRWTSQEFGRALAKGVGVLRVGWPTHMASRRAATAMNIQLDTRDVNGATGLLSDDALNRITTSIELVRSQSQAVRRVNLLGHVRRAVTLLGGRVLGVGSGGGIMVELPDGAHVVAYPNLGVPTSTSIHDAATSAYPINAAVVFDPVGLDPVWLEHLEWLQTNISQVRWVRATAAAWEIAGWTT